MVMTIEEAQEKMAVTPENIRSVKGVFMNWHNYSLLLNNEKYENRKIIPVGGVYFSATQIDMALKSVPRKKREVFYKHYVDGISQSELARSRKPSKVSQALVQWEISEALARVLEFLAEIASGT